MNLQINIVVGNGTSPTSATTASLSGTSQNSLNSESGGGGPAPGGRGSPRLKMVDTFSKKETAIDAMITGGSGPGEMSDSNLATASSASNSTAAGAPIATMEGHEDDNADLKLDGGDVTKTGKVTSPPSCTRLVR